MAEMLTAIAIAVAAICVLCLIFLWFCFYCGAPATKYKQNAINVSCVGDSLTYGMFCKKRSRLCYPAQLEKLLGNGYAVHNFGVNGRTLTRCDDYPYTKHRLHTKSMEMKADIVLIMLGTNDTRLCNVRDISVYMEDLRATVREYAALPSKPEVYVLIPPALFTTYKYLRPFEMSAGYLDEMVSAITAAGDSGEFKVVDTHTPTLNHREYYTLDGLHHNPRGAFCLAQTVFNSVFSQK